MLNNIKEHLCAHREELSQLGVRAISIFGSFARGTEKLSSDVDVLVDFDSRKGIFGFVELKMFLEKLLHKKVDVVTKRALHPALRKRILEEAQHVF